MGAKGKMGRIMCRDGTICKMRMLGAVERDIVGCGRGSGNLKPLYLAHAAGREPVVAFHPHDHGDCGNIPENHN